MANDKASEGCCRIDLVIFVKLALALAGDSRLAKWWEVDSLAICVCLCEIVKEKGTKPPCVYVVDEIKEWKL